VLQVRTRFAESKVPEPLPAAVSASWGIVGGSFLQNRGSGHVFQRGGAICWLSVPRWWRPARCVRSGTERRSRWVPIIALGRRWKWLRPRFAASGSQFEGEVLPSSGWSAAASHLYR